MSRDGTRAAVTWWFEEDDEEVKELGGEYQRILEPPFAIRKG